MGSESMYSSLAVWNIGVRRNPTLKCQEVAATAST